MISRRDTLAGALGDVESRAAMDVSTIVVNDRWWNALPGDERERYREQAGRLGVTLRTDGLLSTHFVELRHGAPERGLSSERPT